MSQPRERYPRAVQDFLHRVAVIPRVFSTYVCKRSGRTYAHNVSGIQALLQHLRLTDPITYRMHQGRFEVNANFIEHAMAHEVDENTLAYVRMRGHLDPIILVELDTGETIIADGRHRARVMIERGEREITAFHLPYDLAHRFELKSDFVRVLQRYA